MNTHIHKIQSVEIETVGRFEERIYFNLCIGDETCRVGTGWSGIERRDLEAHFDNNEIDEVVAYLDQLRRSSVCQVGFEDPDGGYEECAVYSTYKEARKALQYNEVRWLGSEVNERDAGWHWRFTVDQGQTQIRIPLLGGEEIITKKGGLQ